MNVLLFVPLHPTYGVMRQTVASIAALDTTGHDVQVHFNAVPESGPDVFGAITEQYRQAQATTLAGNYDALLTVEADNVLPPDALQRLAAVDTDVAYGLYCNRHAPHNWLALIEIQWGRGITYGRNEPTARAAWGNVVESQGVGFGCTLIYRHVLERIIMRREVGHPCANDWFFAMDCVAAGVRQAHDCGCVVGHVLNDRHSIVWPDAWPVYRIEVNEDMLKAKAIQAETGQQSYICRERVFYRQDEAYYQPGDRIVLEPDQARPLLELGILALDEQTDTPATMPEGA